MLFHKHGINWMKEELQKIEDNIDTYKDTQDKVTLESIRIMKKHAQNAHEHIINQTEFKQLMRELIALKQIVDISEDKENAQEKELEKLIEQIEEGYNKLTRLYPTFYTHIISIEEQLNAKNKFQFEKFKIHVKEASIVISEINIESQIIANILKEIKEKNEQVKKILIGFIDRANKDAWVYTNISSWLD
jgi:hypothetical protein